MLKEAQRKRFAEDGFVVLEAAFDSEALAPVRTAVRRLVQRFDPRRDHAVFSTRDRDSGRDEAFFRSAETVAWFLEEEAVDEDGRLRSPADRCLNKIGHALHDHVPEIGAFARGAPLVSALRLLGHDRSRLWQSMVIFKQPRIGGEVRWHQDASYLLTTPPSVIGCWLALEDADLGNGCLLVQPGGHRSPLRERYRVDWETRKGSLETLDETPWPERADAQALEVPAGSLVLFSDLLPHASAANRSPRSRTAMTFHFADADTPWHPDNWLQRRSLPPFEV